jgi:hypothetical protein
LTIKPADLKTLPRTTVTVSETGRQVSYERVLVGELLRRAGAPIGRDLSGNAVAKYLPLVEILRERLVPDSPSESHRAN